MVQAWLDWGAGQLDKWANWFAADWPQPEGGIGVRRFVGVPSYPEFFPTLQSWRVSAMVQIRGRSELPQRFEYQFVNVNGVTNAGTSSAVGVAVPGFDPATTYEIDMPAGLLYSAWEATAGANNWHNDLRVSSSAGNLAFGSSPASFVTAELARSAFPGGSITGASTYTFWIFDNLPSDNAGGLSLRLRG